MSYWCPRQIALLAGLALTGCGRLAGGDYYGDVMFEIEGTVQADAVYAFEGEVGVALLWTHDEAMADVQAVLVETEFPARYRIKIYKEPEERSRIQVIGGQTLQASVGQILLYEDVNADGIWDEGTEQLIGGAYNAAVLYVPDGVLPYSDAEALQQLADAGIQTPLWTPSEGFHLVNVAPGPFCQLDWESWMQRADERHATLHIGYYAGLGADWDCDGIADFEAPPPVEGEDDWFDDTCAPEEVLLQECDLLRDVLVDFSATDPGDDDYQSWLQNWFPDGQYLECFLEVCPDVVYDFEDVVTPECFDEELEQGCSELEEALQDPTWEQVAEWMGTWVRTSEAWVCFEAACPDLLFEAQQPPNVDDPDGQCPPFGILVEACEDLGQRIDSGADPGDWADDWGYWDVAWCFDQQCSDYTQYLTGPNPPPTCPQLSEVEQACDDLRDLVENQVSTDGWVAQWDYGSRPWCFDDVCPEHTQAL